MKSEAPPQSSLQARAAVRALTASRIRELYNEGLGNPNVLPFWVGEPDEPTPDFIRKAGSDSIAAGELFYTHNLGIPELREALARYLSHLHTGIDPDEVAITTAGVNALMVASQLVVDPGDRVVEVVPLWPNLQEIPKILGASVHTVALEFSPHGWTLNLERLLAALAPGTRALYLNSPNNPTGWTVTAQEQKAILEHCRRHGIWIFADDAYERLYYGEEGTAPSFLDIAAQGDRLISANTFSKSWLMTGWRLGWLVLPRELMADLGKLIEYNTSCAPVFVQRAGIAALKEGEPVIARTRYRFRKARDFLVAELRKIPKVEVALPTGTMYVFFRVDGMQDSLAFCKRLVRDTGLGLAPGSAFGPDGEGFVRWCFAASEDKLADGVARLKRALGVSFARKPLAERFCNLERLLAAMAARGLDGIVATTPLNVFYLSGFNGIAHKADEPRPYALVLSRHAPDHPILVIADYYLATFLSQPSWVRDIRPFRAVMMPLDRAPQREDIDRFIPRNSFDLDWMRAARRHYAFDKASALRGALAELGLERGKVAYDAAEGEGYDVLMHARAVKTPAELELLRRATALNRAAIERTVKSWREGMSWRELNRAYHAAALDLGGFVRDPGAMVWGHPRGAEAALMLQTGLEEFELEAGTHVMFDCHGTLDLYCWDGGKTWVAGDEPTAEGRRNLRATAQVAEQLISEMKPGRRPSELQSRGRELYRKAGVADPDSAVVFFHGIGLSHWDVDSATGDWPFEAGMVVPLHVVYPGGARSRAWLEEVALITPRGGEPFFGWGYEPLHS